MNTLNLIYLYYFELRPARNMVEAASTGAIAAIKVVASVAANLIAILGLVAFLDATLSYMGAKVGYPELSFQVRLSIYQQNIMEFFYVFP